MCERRCIAEACGMSQAARTWLTVGGGCARVAASAERTAVPAPNSYACRVCGSCVRARHRRCVRNDTAADAVACRRSVPVRDRRE